MFSVFLTGQTTVWYSAQISKKLQAQLIKYTDRMNQQNQIKKLRALLPLIMMKDRHGLSRELSRLKPDGRGKTAGSGILKNIDILDKKIQAAIQKREWRASHIPSFRLNPELPIYDKKDEIRESIKNNRVLIISGETGSGKTTQIPKICLQAGRGIFGMIGCTQPRRIAATSVARRIAEEMNEKVGLSVGYKIRFKENLGKNPFVKVMTDGILLAEAQADPWLNSYDTIIVDEAHERSLNIDFILGILKKLLSKRKNLKLIITSATIDTEKFSTTFNQAPVVEVSGRMYPIEVKYFIGHSGQDKNHDQSEPTHVDLAVQAVEKIAHKHASGDILIFMPTEQDIRETCRQLDGRYHHNVSVLPLYARLSSREQARVFKLNSKIRKIIVATNVAETSLTIPGIKFVIDTGLARISQYNPRSRITSLPVIPVSRSSADQRKGRCGRVENGVCIRLFSEEDYQSRPLFTLPDILRSNLAEVILRMIALKLGDIEKFPFIDRPAPKSVSDGFQLLKELGAIREKSGVNHGAKSYALTKTGKWMAKIPIDPRLSRILLEARKQECLEEMTIIAAALSIRDPRERPAEKAMEADEIHSSFDDPASDFITLLNIWNRYHLKRKKLRSMNQLKKYCRSQFLSFKRMLEWRDIHAQINSLLKEFRIKRKPGSIQFDSKAGYNKIHRAILSGFLSNIAVRKEKNFYRAGKGREAMVFPGSGLFNRAGQWIVCSELVETSRLFARTVANIEPDWLEEFGKGLCRYTYLNPHWERNRGEVVAMEQVSLFGLIIHEGRKTPFSPIDPDRAASIFVQEALVGNDIKQSFGFVDFNQALMDDVRNMEDKIRRRDILIHEGEIFQFYLERLPGVSSIKQLRKRIRKKNGDSFLRMDLGSLIRYHPEQALLAQYPDHIKLGEDLFKAEYRFNPGKKADGVTVEVPQDIAPTIRPETTDWLVPGLYREKLTALIKGLPKAYRKKLVPVADTVDMILKDMTESKKSLVSTLAEFIHARFGFNIPATAWREELLPEHLRMRISIIRADGTKITTSRDKKILMGDFEGRGRPREMTDAERKWERKGIKKWDFGDLPDHIELKKGSLVMYPGLEPSPDQKQGPALKLFTSKSKALESHKKGVAGLYELHFSKDLKFLIRNLVLPGELSVAAHCLGGAKALCQQIYDRVVNELFLKGIRKESEFYSHAEHVAGKIMTTGSQLLNAVVPVLAAYAETHSGIMNHESKNRNHKVFLKFLNDLRDQLNRLVPHNFIHLYERNRMPHLTRYLSAMKIRIQKAQMNFEKDRSRVQSVEKYEDRLKEFLRDLDNLTTDEKKKSIEEYFWMIEEYKVSIFAQELKTPQPISAKRLDAKLDEIIRMT